MICVAIGCDRYRVHETDQNAHNLLLNSRLTLIVAPFYVYLILESKSLALLQSLRWESEFYGLLKWADKMELLGRFVQEPGYPSFAFPQLMNNNPYNNPNLIGLQTDFLPRPSSI